VQQLGKVLGTHHHQRDDEQDEKMARTEQIEHEKRPRVIRKNASLESAKMNRIAQ
jgi:hypothetical protein